MTGKESGDSIGLDARGLLIHGAIGRIAADNLFVAEQESCADNFENFARSRGQQNVFGLDAMMVRDCLRNSTIGISVAIRILHRILNCLHHGFRRAVWVLVVREFGK